MWLYGNRLFPDRFHVKFDIAYVTGGLYHAGPEYNRAFDRLCLS